MILLQNSNVLPFFVKVNLFSYRNWVCEQCVCRSSNSIIAFLCYTLLNAINNNFLTDALYVSNFALNILILIVSFVMMELLYLFVGVNWHFSLLSPHYATSVLLWRLVLMQQIIYAWRLYYSRLRHSVRTFFVTCPYWRCHSSCSRHVTLALVRLCNPRRKKTL